MPDNKTATSQPGLLRLIGTVLYDWLIVIGLLMLAGFIAVGVNKLITGEDAIASGNPAFLSWNIGVTFLYFAGFWISKRQTVGMKAWRVHLTTTDQTPLSWKHVTLRFFCAIPSWGLLMAGVLWRYFNPRRLSWHDQYSQTRLVYTPKQKA